MLHILTNFESDVRCISLNSEADCLKEFRIPILIYDTEMTHQIAYKIHKSDMTIRIKSFLIDPNKRRSPGSAGKIDFPGSTL